MAYLVGKERMRVNITNHKCHKVLTCNNLSIPFEIVFVHSFSCCSGHSVVHTVDPDVEGNDQHL